MKIYTKTGDQGETSLFGGSRVSKSDLRIETYGTVDELNSLIGVCRSSGGAAEVDSLLQEIQHDLFTLGADLATPRDSRAGTVNRISPQDVVRLERHIDAIDPLLDPLQNFILPGGTLCGSLLHYARTVCRRAERLVVALASRENIGGEPLIYLNRLSDLLFVIARRVNALSNSTEKKWFPPEQKARV